MAAVFSLENQVFSRFAFYGCAVAVKTMVMSLLTARQRIQRGIFANLEDSKSFSAKKGDPKVDLNDANVERIRRCHLNDLENVIPFILIGLLYVATGPDLWWATMHFRVFAASRILHTICYLTPIPQPSRASMFLLGWGTTLSMAISVLKNAQF